ncbi:hypothetical protein SAMN02745248_01751 [Hathewaya proteolytica DSM 3090]|uniref:Uncharacterized protein n=1 Tax=Hathewaya proteolytica DSM 3090 TaxID=1121331 RepID=A0A1M6PLE5_9CLOT|nr:hypothetical protein [Hathewaya proteolytica]SHK08782.1 hypothetical protein SAMN02745248_01751 [Hathewaya proteolytica DSM 3090]
MRKKIARDSDTNTIIKKEDIKNLDVSQFEKLNVGGIDEENIEALKQVMSLSDQQSFLKADIESFLNQIDNNIILINSAVDNFNETDGKNNINLDVFHQAGITGITGENIKFVLKKLSDQKVSADLGKIGTVAFEDVAKDTKTKKPRYTFTAKEIQKVVNDINNSLNILSKKLMLIRDIYELPTNTENNYDTKISLVKIELNRILNHEINGGNDKNVQVDIVKNGDKYSVFLIQNGVYIVKHNVYIEIKQGKPENPSKPDDGNEELHLNIDEHGIQVAEMGIRIVGSSCKNANITFRISSEDEDYVYLDQINADDKGKFDKYISMEECDSKAYKIHIVASNKTKSISKSIEFNYKSLRVPMVKENLVQGKDFFVTDNYDGVVDKIKFNAGIFYEEDLTIKLYRLKDNAYGVGEDNLENPVVLSCKTKQNDSGEVVLDEVELGDLQKGEYRFLLTATGKNDMESEKDDGHVITITLAQGNLEQEELKNQAYKLVSKAEIDNTKESYDAAKVIVDKIKDTVLKNELMARLNKVKECIDNSQINQGVGFKVLGVYGSAGVARVKMQLVFKGTNTVIRDNLNDYVFNVTSHEMVEKPEIDRNGYVFIKIKQEDLFNRDKNKAQGAIKITITKKDESKTVVAKGNLNKEVNQGEYYVFIKPQDIAESTKGGKLNITSIECKPEGIINPEISSGGSIQFMPVKVGETVVTVKVSDGVSEESISFKVVVAKPAPKLLKENLQQDVDFMVTYDEHANPKKISFHKGIFAEVGYEVRLYKWNDKNGDNILNRDNELGEYITLDSKTTSDAEGNIVLLEGDISGIDIKQHKYIVTAVDLSTSKESRISQDFGFVIKQKVMLPEKDEAQIQKEALEAVVKAEGSKLQVDVDSAREIVKESNNEEFKKNMITRLDYMANRIKKLEEGKEVIGIEVVSTSNKTLGTTSILFQLVNEKNGQLIKEDLNSFNYHAINCMAQLNNDSEVKILGDKIMITVDREFTSKEDVKKYFIIDVTRKSEANVPVFNNTMEITGIEFYNKALRSTIKGIAKTDLDKLIFDFSKFKIVLDDKSYTLQSNYTKAEKYYKYTAGEYGLGTSSFGMGLTESDVKGVSDVIGGKRNAKLVLEDGWSIHSENGLAKGKSIIIEL